MLMAYDADTSSSRRLLALSLCQALPTLKTAVKNLSSSSAADVCLAMVFHMTVSVRART